LISRRVSPARDPREARAGRFASGRKGGPSGSRAAAPSVRITSGQVDGHARRSVSRSVATHLKKVRLGTWKNHRGERPGAHLHGISQNSPRKCLAALVLVPDYRRSTVAMTVALPSRDSFLTRGSQSSRRSAFTNRYSSTYKSSPEIAMPVGVH